MPVQLLFQLKLFPKYSRKCNESIKQLIISNKTKKTYLIDENILIIIKENQHQFAGSERDADGQTFVVGAKYNVGQGEFSNIKCGEKKWY